MPIQNCTKNGKKGKKWGHNGQCYIGPNARSLALKQGRSIEISKRKQGKALEIINRYSVLGELIYLSDAILEAVAELSDEEFEETIKDYYIVDINDELVYGKKDKDKKKIKTKHRKKRMKDDWSGY